MPEGCASYIGAMRFLHGSTILAALLFLVPASLFAQTVTAPSGAVTVPTAGDFFSSAFQKPADMNDRNDLGWFLYGVDQPRANISNPTVSGGVFSGVAATADPNIYLLETGNPVSVPRGRRGDVQAIPANQYRTVAVRMRLSGSPGVRVSDGQLMWTAKTIYDSPLSVAGSFSTYGGWQVYFFDIPTMGLAAGSAWSGSVGSLRLDPTIVAGSQIDIDWMRLTTAEPASVRTITWSGGGAVDIYLDIDTNEANGTLGLIAKNNTTLSKGVTGGAFTFQPGALPPGDYYVGMRTSGTSNALRYSAGYYHVEGVPMLRFSSPSPEGSADDFATTQLGNPWDMQSTSDVDFTANVSSPRIAALNVQTPDGGILGAPNVYLATGSSGDPILYLLAGHMRGASKPIDSNYYRIATVEMGLPGDRNINGGSIARLVWRVKGETAEVVSEDIIINHRSGANVLDSFTFDMKNLPIEPGAGSPSHTGWNGLIDEFRLDPHEFTPATEFWVRKVKLAALERAGSSYRIAWGYDAQNSGATLSLWYDSDRSGFDGTRIIDGVSPTDGGYTWNTAGLVPGQEYFIYFRLTDSTGRVVSQAYAAWPIVGGGTGAASPAPAPVPGGTRPMMSVDLPGANAVVEQPFAIGGWAIDAGATADSGVDRIDVWATRTPGASPDIFLGTASYGGARPDIAGYFGGQFVSSGYGLAVKGLTPGVYQIVVYARSRLTGTNNNLRTVTVTVAATPRMSIDTPGNNQSLGSSFLVAGWATDLAAASGSGVDAVQVWAYPNPGSGTPARFLGSATLGGSRPDVASFFGPNAQQSGYGLVVSGVPPGVYDLAVFMHSTLTGTFSNVQVVRITVR